MGSLEHPTLGIILSGAGNSVGWWPLLDILHCGLSQLKKTTSFLGTLCSIMDHAKDRNVIPASPTWDPSEGGGLPWDCLGKPHFSYKIMFHFHRCRSRENFAINVLNVNICLRLCFHEKLIWNAIEILKMYSFKLYEIEDDIKEKNIINSIFFLSRKPIVEDLPAHHSK